MAMPDTTLAGVRVLDLTDETAVLGAKVLSDLGADVIRVEPPEGDPIRWLGPLAEPDGGLPHLSLMPPHPVLSPGEGLESAPGVGLPLAASERGSGGEVLSLSHLWFNSGKRSIILDLRTTPGRARLSELATGADIVIETGGMGVDWAAIRADRPGLTVVSVSGYGLTGPRRDWLVPDVIAWALSGAMGISGVADRSPLRANWAVANQIGGLSAAIGALAGLRSRRITGRGIHVDLSRVEAIASLHSALMPLYTYGGGLRQARQGVELAVSAPYGAFPTRDGRVILIAATVRQWQALLEWMRETGRLEKWLLSEEVSTLSGRAPYHDPIHDAVGRWTREMDTADLVTEANRRRIPCAPINGPLDVLADTQLRARGFFVPVEIPSLGRTIDLPGLPYHFNEGGGSVRPAPEWAPSEGEGVSWLPRRGDGQPSGRASTPAVPGVTSDSQPPTPDSLAPLSGLRVLDLTWVLAGPLATRALADLGATVVKVEPREIGEVLRGQPPHWQGRLDYNQCGFFHRINRNKRDLTVDLKKPEGIALIKRLAAWADVVVDNFGAAVMERLGLGPQILGAIKPELIRVSLSGYGQTGPTRDYPSFALISEARGGFVHGTGYPDGLPTGCGLLVGDTGASLQLAVAILAAVDQARRTGRGPYVDMSQLEAATIFVAPALIDAAVNGRSFAPRGNLLPDRDAAPHGAFPTKGDDRWIAIAVLDEDQWARLTGAMDRPALSEDPRFRTAADRVAHVDALDAIIADWTRDQDAHALAARLQAAGVPAGAVQDAADLLHHDPQIAARGFYQMVDQPEIGPVPLDTSPLRWDGDPVPIHTPAPLIGEHNEEVLSEVLGLDEAGIVDLILGEVI